MHIVMMTNTYRPIVGGVTRSIDSYAAVFRRRGHRVLIVAPESGSEPDDEPDVVRMTALQNFNGSDFSVVLPVPNRLGSIIDDFAPDVIHAHHPFLVGSTALRLAHARDLPLVFTQHTLYEHYTHYVPGDSPELKRFVIGLSTNYANLCDRVFAPSESIAELLRQRGVETPIDVQPTGISPDEFRAGSGPGFRAVLGIPRDAFVVGHVGRLAPEKNLRFLAESVARFMASNPRARFLLVGDGPGQADIEAIFAARGVSDRLLTTGSLMPPFLTSAYHAMDAFAFASRSETQGIVLAEAMAAGVPVVALDAAGVREVVNDGMNGRLLADPATGEFADALHWLADMASAEHQAVLAGARATAARFDIETLAERALQTYRRIEAREPDQTPEPFAELTATLRLIEAEWAVIKGMAGAVSAAIGSGDDER